MDAGDKANDNDIHVSAPPPASSFTTACFCHYDVMSLMLMEHKNCIQPYKVENMR